MTVQRMNLLKLRLLVDEVVEENDEVEDVGMNPDVDDVVNKPDHEEIQDVQDDVDEVGILDHHRSGMLILTPMASHTGVGLLMQDEVVEINVDPR